MKLTNLFAFSFVSIALIACASDNDAPTQTGNQASKVQARRAFDGASGRIESAFGALDDNRVAPLGEVIDYSEPCSLGGSVDLNGQFDYNETSADSSIDLTASFSACQEEEGLIDGSLHWTSAMSADHAEDDWTGTITVEDASGSYTCAFDLHTVLDNADITYSGSICGYDVNADLGL